MDRSLTLRNDIAEIARLKMLLNEMAATLKWGGDFLHELTLAIDELVTNIIEHGFGDSGEHVFLVTIRGTPNLASCELRDDAPSFNPLEHIVRSIEIPLEDRPPGGLGILLAREFVDSMNYKREDGWNILTLQKTTGSAGSLVEPD
jgi:anti-sigma regulatory factor (Ser/Thr protein kinase)